MLYESRINSSNSRLIVWVDEQFTIVSVGGEKYKAGGYFSGSDVCRHIIICGAAARNLERVWSQDKQYNWGLTELAIMLEWLNDMKFPRVLFYDSFTSYVNSRYHTSFLAIL